MSITNFNRVTVRRRAIRPLWRTVPAITVLLAMIPGLFTPLLAPLPILLILYWSLFQPQRIGFPFLLVAGLIQDVLLSSLFGSSALLLLVVRYIAMRQRHEISGEGFLIEWLYVGVVLFLALVLQWAMLSLAAKMMMPMLPVVAASVVCIPLYPGLHSLLASYTRYMHRKYWYILKHA